MGIAPSGEVPEWEEKRDKDKKGEGLEGKKGMGDLVRGEGQSCMDSETRERTAGSKGQCLDENQEEQGWPAQWIPFPNLEESPSDVDRG